MTQARAESRIIDISPPVGPETAVWPGDRQLERTWQMRVAKGDSVDLSFVTTTVHIGAHADAPSHFVDGDLGIDAVSLEPYVGRCQVIEIQNCTLIMPSHITSFDPSAPRVLFKTLSQPDFRHFNTDFTALSPEVVTWLGERGVCLVGIDTASVDPFESKELLAHKALKRWQMRNLEGLDLSQVRPGLYELIALPLRLVGFDASPVRAILRTL